MVAGFFMRPPIFPLTRITPYVILQHMARKLTSCINLNVTPAMKQALLRMHLKELPQADFSAWLRGKLAALVKESK